MDRINGFAAETYLRGRRESVFIGKLEGKPAIYTLPDPCLDASTFLRDLNLDASTSLKGPGVSLHKQEVALRCVPRLIWPASQKHIEKYLKSFRYVAESYADYKSSDDYLQTSWLDNVIENKAVNEEVYFEDGESMVLANYKWDRVCNDDLYLLMIFKDPSLRSIRDIRDAGILERARSNILKICKSRELGEEDICMFVHYRPSYFRLHIHIVNISKTTDSLGDLSRDVFLDDVVRNIRMDQNYYKNDMHFIGLE